ncbi:hypothetical protein BDW75DRAFT_198610 [Aspergillus navahoensis]
MHSQTTVVPMCHLTDAAHCLLGQGRQTPSRAQSPDFHLLIMPAIILILVLEPFSLSLSHDNVDQRSYASPSMEHFVSGRSRIPQPNELPEYELHSTFLLRLSWSWPISVALDSMKPALTGWQWMKRFLESSTANFSC